MEDRFEYKDIQNIDIKGVLFDIEISGGTNNEVLGQIETDNKHFKMVHHQENNRLIIRFKRTWWAIFNIPQKHKLTMQVPHLSKLQINNSSGNINFENIQGELIEAQATSGQIKARNINGQQNYQTSSGNISLTAASAASQTAITLNTRSGKILVAKTQADIKAESSSGKQTYENGSGQITAASSSGEINITQHRGALNLSASSGNLKTTSVKLTADSYFKTSSGDITVDYTNSFEDFTFDLSSTSGKLKVGLANAHGVVHTGKGPIKIKGRTTSGKQIYR